MRRGSQSNVGGGYNKPPPGPISHGTGRVRLHTPDSSGPILKERFGSLPISPSHLMNSRDKSPNPTSQDLHDCLMCLSAYIQSLNTVCGTACRLAQCLSQVGAENVDPHSTGPQLPQILKEAAEIWEGIARVMGVTSTGVKNQMIQLMQDIQKRHNMDSNDQTQRQEVAKIVKLMLSTFLNLHCQFSRIVVEKFSGVLQFLKDDSIVGPNGFYTDAGTIRTQASPNVSPHRPSPSPPHGNMQYSPFGSANTSPHQLLHQQIFFQQQQQQQQQQLVLQQQLLQMAQQQQYLHLNSKHSINENAPTKEDNNSRHSSGSSLGYASFSGGRNGSPGNSQPQPPSSPNFNTSHGSGNTLSPGLLSSYSGISSNDWSADAISRRWSMGGDEGWQEQKNSLSPFSLMANRRWSVPETTEHDMNVGFRGIQPFYSHCNVQDPNFPMGCQTSQSWSGTKSSLHPLSRENSSTRSPSHSRSVTPEQKRPSIVSNEELDDVIDLLSLPLSPLSRKSSKSSVSSSNSYAFISPNRRESDQSSKKLINPQRIPEDNQEQPNSIKPEPPDIACTSWPSTGTDRKCSLSKSETESMEDGQTQISTPLWPPTENVPGVTLTECIGRTEESDSSNCWPGDANCASRVDGSFSRGRSADNTSSFSRYGIMDDFFLSGHSSTELEKGGWTPTLRRHSTDAPFLFTPNQISGCAKTRSFENIATLVDFSGESGIKRDSSVEGLLCLGSLNSPFSSSNNSQYTLFTSS